MTRVLVDDPDLARHLLAARAQVEVCDSTGLTLGRFVPQGLYKADTSDPSAQRTGDVQDDEFWKAVGIE